MLTRRQSDSSSRIDEDDVLVLILNAYRVESRSQLFRGGRRAGPAHHVWNRGHQPRACESDGRGAESLGPPGSHLLGLEVGDLIDPPRPATECVSSEKPGLFAGAGDAPHAQDVELWQLDSARAAIRPAWLSRHRGLSRVDGTGLRRGIR